MRRCKVFQRVTKGGQDALAKKLGVVEFVDDDVGAARGLQVGGDHFGRGLVDEVDVGVHAVGAQASGGAACDGRKALAGSYVCCTWECVHASGFDVLARVRRVSGRLMRSILRCIHTCGVFLRTPTGTAHHTELRASMYAHVGPHVHLLGMCVPFGVVMQSSGMCNLGS